jgi:flagellar hook-associated protein 1 FlgK
MADLLSILSSSSTSLSAQGGLLATASHNIDNANTPGYARQIAALEAVTPAEQVNGAYIGRGSALTTVTQARDRFLEAQIPKALGDAAYSTAQSDALQAFHGLDLTDSGGLDSAISGFYSSLRALAQNPGDSGLRTSFLGAAQTLARSFNSTAGELESARSGLDAQASGLAGEITTEAQAVADLNVQIRQASASGAAPNDLLDLRQQHLDNLAELAGATTVATSQGDVNVTLPGGLALVSGGSAGSLSTTPDASGHVTIRITPPGGGPISLASSTLGGTLGGTLAARDGALKTAGDQLDQFAFDLASALNTVHQAGYGTDGSHDLDLFTVGASAGGAASQLAVAITDPAQLAMAGAGGGSGDATNADLLIQTEMQGLGAGGKDVPSTLSAIVSQFGSATASAKAFADQDGAIKDNLTSLRESYSGVSIDEEMITMQQAQRGYEAISKVIQTADQMLETLLNLR